MKEKLLLVVQKLKSWTVSLAQKWPLPMGIAMGYLCHAEIKLALDVAVSLAKEILKLV